MSNERLGLYCPLRTAYVYIMNNVSEISMFNLLASWARLCFSQAPNELFVVDFDCSAWFLIFSTNFSAKKFRERLSIEHTCIWRHSGHGHRFRFPFTFTKHFSQKLCPHLVDLIGNSNRSKSYITINGTVLRDYGLGTFSMISMYELRMKFSYLNRLGTKDLQSLASGLL